MRTVFFRTGPTSFGTERRLKAVRRVVSVAAYFPAVLLLAVSCGSGRDSPDRIPPPSFTLLRNVEMGSAVIAAPVFMRDADGDPRLCAASSEGRISMIDPLTGTVLWTAETGNGFEASPAYIPPVAGSPAAVAAASLEGEIFLFDFWTGESLGRKAGFGSLKGGAATGRTGTGEGYRLYLGDYDSTLYGIDVPSLSVGLKFRAENYINGAPCLIGRNRVAFGSCDGSLYVLDAGTFEKIYSFDAGSYVAGGPIAYDGMLYFVNYEGDAFALDENGRPGWEFRVTLQEPAVASPLPTGTLIVYGTRRGNVRALNRKDGTEAWVFAAGSPVEFTPVETAYGIVVCSTSGRLSLLDASSGTETAFFSLGSQPSMSAAWDGSLLAAGTETGRLAVFSLGGKK